MEEKRLNDWKNNNPNPFIDMAGKRVNMLTVLYRVDSIKGKTMWRCLCDCGKEIDVSYGALSKGQYSCGCATKGLIAKSKTIHGKSDTRLFNVWSKMKERCYRSTHKSYKYYGGKGIRVCDEWLNDFMAFYEWAMSAGYKEDAEFMQCTLDRIDPNGNYEPSNCRWVSAKEQANNRTNNRVVNYKGLEHTISEWAELLGLKRCTIWRRLQKGWPVEEALGFEGHVHKRFGKVYGERTHYDEYRLVGETK